jgi:hypothetical protein
MLGLALSSSTTLAIAMEQAKPERGGPAMRTFSISLPLSDGAGALVCGSLVQGFGFLWMYLALAGFAVAGLVLIFVNRARLNK